MSKRRVWVAFFDLKVSIVLRNGEQRDLLGVDDADVWARSFGGRGTSLLGDWLEVIPDKGRGRTSFELRK